MSHLELVQAIGGDRSNIGHSLRTLEARGLVTVGRSPGGKAEYVALTPEGLKLTSETAQSGE
jgi:DNA-binding MarR family transcriptional regulator